MARFISKAELRGRFATELSAIYSRDVRSVQHSMTMLGIQEALT